MSKDMQQVAPPFAEDLQRAEGLSGTPEGQKPRVRERKIYGVPRRFDIATLLVASLVYSLLFTVLRLVNMPWTGSLFVGGLTVFVGVAQAMFPYGIQPRTASAVAGILYIMLWLAGLKLFTGDSVTWLGLIVMSTLAGIGLRYSCGVGLAGLFLIADNLRRWWYTAAPSEEGADAKEDVAPAMETGDET